MLMVRLAIADDPVPFLAMIPTSDVPEVVGVPVIWPVSGFSERPVGRDPAAIEKLVGRFEAVIWVLKGDPTEPAIV